MRQFARLLTATIGARAALHMAVTSTSLIPETVEERIDKVEVKEDYKRRGEEYRMKKHEPLKIEHNHSGESNNNDAMERSEVDDIMHQAVVSGVVNNPGVMLGLVLTCCALLGMVRKSYTGDRLGAQRFMQYRIIAQFFTLFALIGGVGYFSYKYGKVADAAIAERKAKKLAEKQQ